MTIREALTRGAEVLRQVPDGALDAEYLLADALQMGRLEMRLEKQRELTVDQQKRYEALLSRRAEREPLQYILGSQVFMGFAFHTDARALIPRFDTECIVERALSLTRPGGKVLDLCTGTGAIAISLKKLCPGAWVTATDLSGDALCLAGENAAALGAEIELLQGDLFAPVAGRVFDVIVSNPPYIPWGERTTLQQEVLREPDMALFAGADGLDFYRRIAREAPEHLKAGGALVLEMGDNQFSALSALLGESFRDIALIRDLGGRPRGAAAYLK